MTHKFNRSWDSISIDRFVSSATCVLIPLILLFAVSQVLPPSLCFEVNSSRLVCVFVLMVLDQVLKVSLLFSPSRNLNKLHF